MCAQNRVSKPSPWLISNLKTNIYGADFVYQISMEKSFLDYYYENNIKNSSNSEQKSVFFSEFKKDIL